MYKKREKKEKKSKNSGADGIRSVDVWIENPSPYRLSYEGLAPIEWQQNIFIAIVIMKVKFRTIGNCTMFRHNIHSNFYISIKFGGWYSGIFLIIGLPNHDKSRKRIESASKITLMTAFRGLLKVRCYPLLPWMITGQLLKDTFPLWTAVVCLLLQPCDGVWRGRSVMQHDVACLYRKHDVACACT
jgi:hypothetical protein